MLQIYFASSVTSGSHHCPAAGALGLCQPSTGCHIKWAGELGVWDANEGKAGKVVKDSAAERQRAQPGAGTPRPCRMDGVSGAAVGVWGGQWGLTEQEPVPFSLGPVESLWGARKVLIRLKVTHSKQNTWPRDPSQPCHLWHCFKSSPGEVRTEWRGGKCGCGCEFGGTADWGAGGCPVPQLFCAEGRWDQKPLPLNHWEGWERPTLFQQLTSL